MDDFANFYVSARIALQLGRESISSSLTAILELVKNAYDADATEVRLTFFDYQGGLPAGLLVEDDGHGMSHQDIIRRWMFIGDSEKIMAKRTRSRGRVLTGEKGLGRLGLDRLCAKTIVQSRSEQSSPGVELEIDWSAYEGSSVSLEQIKHPIRRLGGFTDVIRKPLLRSHDVGTRLVLIGLKDEWSQELLKELHSELALLLSPLGGVQDFHISVGENGGQEEPLNLVPSMEVLDAAAWKVRAKINDDGTVVMGMTSRRHEQAYSTGLMNWANAFKGLGATPLCGPLEMTFYFIPRSRTKSPSASIDADVSRAKVSAFMDANQGIRIYRDGFRVKPYGDPQGEGDWLRLAARRVRNPQGVKQSKWNVGPNQVTGGVFISREKNAALADQANREGIMEGKAFAHLRAFASSVIQWFEANNQAYQKSLDKPSQDLDLIALDALAATRQATSRLVALQKNILKVFKPGSIVSTESLHAVRGILVEAAGDVSKSEDHVRRTAEGAKSARLEAARQKDTLGNLASLGILSASFGHETLNSSGNILKASRYFQTKFFPSLVGKDVDLDVPTRWLDVMSSDSVRVERFARFALGNVLREKRRKSIFSVSSVAAYVFESFSDFLAKDRGINIDLALSPGGVDKINAYEGDWECVFINLITNSVWAMTRVPGDNRRISVRVSVVGDNCVIVFSDSGFGLEEGTEELIFQPTFTTRRNERGEPTGTGLGLSLVKTFIVENSSGVVRALRQGELGGAEFNIQVPLAKEAV